MARINWLIIVLLSVVLIALFVIPILPRWHFEQQLSSLSKNESAFEYVYVANHDKLHINNTEHDMNAIVKDCSEDGYFKQVVVVDGDRIWFVYIEHQQVGQRWYLASIDFDGHDFNVHCSDTFMAAQNSKHFEVSNDCQPSFFENKSCYYYDGKIVLTDHVKVIEYDIITEEAKEFYASEYIHPFCPYSSEISNFNMISISNQIDCRTLTFTDAAEKCKEFGSLMELSDQKTWNGTPILTYLFDSVIYDGVDIYLVCRILNYGGETHLVVFRYLFELDELEYCLNHFNNDVINNGFYIIPECNN